MKQRHSNRQARAGFTLMELMLVMAILVILIGLVAPRFMGAQEGANISSTKTQIGLFKSSLDMYRLHLNGYPTTEQGLAAMVEEPSDVDVPDRWQGPYLDSGLPIDPWGNEYQYEYPPTRNTADFPDIWSMGPDGEDGTDDDIGNWPDEDREDELADL